ncbi:hypothetical protein P886_4191 [Alteromonadaceae bacterium 2753L.S.0a.02]|nr:hypothetical protein P886_4191 [Alteromonadaceae bacterium 2753L.S.0a.02]
MYGGEGGFDKNTPPHPNAQMPAVSCAPFGKLPVAI